MNTSFYRSTAGLLIVAILAPSLFLIAPNTASAVLYTGPSTATEGASDFGSPLGGSLDQSVTSSGGLGGSSSLSVQAQSVGIGTEGGSLLGGAGQGVGSAVGNLGACAAEGVAEIGVSLGIGATAVATAPAAAFTGIPVHDNALYVLMGGDVAFNSATAVATEFQTVIDCFLNALVILLREVIIAQVTASIVAWINGGFDGNPLFIQDPKQFFQNVADQTIGEFLGGIGLSFVCSPFQLQIKRALSISYGSTVRNACTLSGIVKNIDNFLSGGFGNDGWAGWFAIASNPTNTLAGSYLQADIELSAKIVNAQGQELNLANWGNGFLSSTQCDPPGSKQNCVIKTPGSVLNNQLNKVLESNGIAGRLAMSSQINQIIGALINQAMNHIFNSGGLSGLSQGSYGSPSPLQQTITIAQQENTAGQANILMSELRGSYQTMQRYEVAVKDLQTRLSTSKSLLVSAQGCYQKKLNIYGLLTSDQRATALAAVADLTATMASSTTPLETTLSNSLAVAANVETEIGALIGQAGTLKPDAVSSARNDYQSLLQGGVILTPQNVSAAAAQFETQKQQFDQLDTATQSKLDACLALPGNTP